MYTIQVFALMLDRGRPCGEEWVDLATVSQRESDDHELAEAKSLAGVARGYHRRVRIVKSLPNGLLQHVTG